MDFRRIPPHVANINNAGADAQAGANAGVDLNGPPNTPILRRINGQFAVPENGVWRAGNVIGYGANIGIEQVIAFGAPNAGNADIPNP